jgi:hypothetical protein
MIEGFCTVHRDDVPSTPDRRCATDGMLLIAPSWSSKDARYPWPERPEGYVYRPPVFPELKPARSPATRRTEPVAPPPRPVGRRSTCEQCGSAFEDEGRGGSPRRYCSPLCKGRAQHARRGHPVQGPDRTCRRCGAGFTVGDHGGRQVYCSKACKHRAHEAARTDRPRAGGRTARADARPRTIPCEACGTRFEFLTTGYANRRRFCSEECYRRARRPTMGERGLACPCGRSDTRAMPGGVCDACYSRVKRARQRAGVAP